MRDFLFVQPFLTPPGGGEGVANWMLQALVSRGQVTVLTWDPPNFAEIDRYYGTSLEGHPNLHTQIVAPLFRKLFLRLRVPHRLLRVYWLERAAKALRSSHRHCFSAYNELDLGPPSVQYVHHPSQPKGVFGEPPCAWPDSPLLVRIWPLYLWLCRRLSPHDLGRIQKNITVCNSHWTGRALARLVNVPTHAVLYPPPLGRPLSSDPLLRRPDFISIARIERTKNWLKLIEIIRRVRELGHEVKLSLAGSREDPELLVELQQLEQQHSDWLRLYLNEPREVLDRLIVEHQYAIHGMVQEHYGMAVAELVLSGCLTFVHDSGGQVEIVPQHETRYTEVDDAVEKIHAVLTDESLRRTLLADQAKNRANITRETFLADLHALVDRLESGETLRPIALREPDYQNGEPER